EVAAQVDTPADGFGQGVDVALEVTDAVGVLDRAVDRLGVGIGGAVLAYDERHSRVLGGDPLEHPGQPLGVDRPAHVGERPFGCDDHGSLRPRPRTRGGSTGLVANAVDVVVVHTEEVDGLVGGRQLV